MADDKLTPTKNLTEIDTDEYHAYKYFYLEVPISTDNIFVNDEQVFSDDFFNNKTYNNDFLKSLLPIGSSVYIPTIEDSNSSFTRKTYDRIGMLTDIDLLSRTITIGLDTLKDKEIANMLSEIDNDTFHYYARLNMYVRLGGLKLVRDKRKEPNVYLLRISRQHDEIKSKANVEDNSKCDLTSGSSIVAINNFNEVTHKEIIKNTYCDDDVGKKINNIDASPFLTKEEADKTYLTYNSIDLSNYYTKPQVDALIKQQKIIDNSSSADDINNRYDENMLIPITASNVESWIARYIYSDSDRFRNYISCGTKFTIQDGIYNAQWVVVGADTEIGKGDIPLTKPHLSLIPVTDLGIAQMNDSMTTYGAYVNSEMNTKTIPAIVKALQKVLGSHLLARRVKLAYSVGGSESNSNAYYTVYANLLCERQIWGKSTYENSYDIGDDTTALPGFKNYKDKIYGSSDFWLRSVYNNSSFVLAYSDSTVYDYFVADHSSGVRPLITIG